MTNLEKMMADAKECNRKLRVESSFKDYKKHPPSKPVPTKRMEIGVTEGKSWRNHKLTDQEVSDIRYYLEKGWCVTSTAAIVGVSISTVKRFK